MTNSTAFMLIGATICYVMLCYVKVITYSISVCSLPESTAEKQEVSFCFTKFQVSIFFYLLFLFFPSMFKLVDCNLRLLNTVFGTYVPTIFSKTLDPLVAKNGSKQV